MFPVNGGHNIPKLHHIAMVEAKKTPDFRRWTKGVVTEGFLVSRGQTYILVSCPFGVRGSALSAGRGNVY
jgi:hypothetical protein